MSAEILNPNLRRVVLASNNAGKLREFSALFAPLGIELVPQSELGVSEAEEPHATFVENALAKARHASRHTGLPALADDSGLCVVALGGAPGVHSARYAQQPGGARSDAANNALLVRTENDPCPLIGEGLWHGEIVDAPAGEHGFGYDPHFYLPQQGCTAAQLAPEHKNRISHRAQALAQLLDKLRATGPVDRP